VAKVCIKLSTNANGGAENAGLEFVRLIPVLHFQSPHAVDIVGCGELAEHEFWNDRQAYIRRFGDERAQIAMFHERQ